MPVERIPLLGEYNTRGVTDASPADGKDYRLINFVPRLVADELSKKLTPYIERRSGWETVYSVGSSVGLGIYFWATIGGPIVCRELSAAGTCTVYAGNDSVGVIDVDTITSISEGRFSGLSTIMITTGVSGWYLPADAYSDTAYTADGNNSTTITDIKIAGVNSVSGLYVGQKLSAATNVTAGSRIVSINSGAFSAVLSAATTGGAFNDLAITKEPIAKITDTDFPTAPYSMAELDGRAYAIDRNTLRIHESAINNVASWSASALVDMDAEVFGNVALAKIGQRLYAMCGQRIEVYFNNGNQSGAVISRIDEATIEMGMVNYCLTYSAAFFIGQSNGAYSGMFSLTQAGIKKISTPTLDAILSNYDPASGNPSAFFMWGQNGLYIQNGTTTGVMQFIEASKIGEMSAPSALLLSGSIATTQAVWALGVSNGTVYRMQSASPVYQDNGSTFTATVQTARGTRGTQKRKIAHALRLICDRYSSGTVTVSVCDSDDGSYTSIGTFDLTVMNPVIYRCGFYYGRSYKLEHAVNGPFRAIALEEEYEVCSA